MFVAPSLEQNKGRVCHNCVLLLAKGSAGTKRLYSDLTFVNQRAGVA